VTQLYDLLEGNVSPLQLSKKMEPLLAKLNNNVDVAGDEKHANQALHLQQVGDVIRCSCHVHF
jgi:hypothetical protein